MAAYVSTRRRLLRGMGATFTFVPRRRGLRGLGQDSTDIDVVTGLPCDDPRANCGPDIFSQAGSVKPVIPAKTPAPVVIAPSIGPAVPGPVQLVFPSVATVPPPPKYAPPPTVSWFDQQMISGIPNSYLALGTVGLVLFVSISSAKRRR